MRVSFVGDALMTRSLQSALAAGHLNPTDLLLPDTDIGVCNLETLFHNYEHPANAFKGGLWLQCSPQWAHDLRAAGFDLAARANNHALDYGAGGLASTSEALERAGILSAGAGRDYESAFTPVVMDTPVGSLALVSACSTLPLGFAATRGRSPIPGRPGVAPLRHTFQRDLDNDAYAGLCRALGVLYGWEPSPATRRIKLDSLTVLRTEDPSAASLSVADAEDLTALVEAVESAATKAEHVLVSLHCHESGATREEPADFMREAARAAAASGATLVFGHGPHVVRGMEIHDGVPILYSLGNFIFQYDQVGAVPDDARRESGLPVDATDTEVKARGLDYGDDPRFWEGLSVQADFSDGRCTGLIIVPLLIRSAKDDPARGIPYRMRGASAVELLQRFSALSPAVEVSVVDSLGRVRVTADDMLPAADGTSLVSAHDTIKAPS